MVVLPGSGSEEGEGALPEGTPPRDPQEYKAKSDSTDYPSFFAWPEWASFKKKFDIKEVKLDLGGLGHERRKPTTLGTNIKALGLLDGLSAANVEGKNVMNIPLEQKVKETRSWAAWPEPFKLKIVEGLRLELEHPVVSKMSSDDWARRRALDHMPFNRECPECQKGAGRSRPHRRIPAPDTFTLSLDLCGPFRPGKDMEEAKSRYMMVGVFTIPVARKSRELVPLVPGLGEILAKEKVAVEEGDLEGPLLPEVEEGGDDIPGHVNGDPGDMEKWEEMVEPEEVEVRNYTLVEVLSSRNGEAITLAMARMVARLGRNALG